MAETVDKKVYVVARPKKIGNAGAHIHVGGNLLIGAAAKSEPEKISDNEKKSLVYFPGEIIPEGVKPGLIQAWVRDGKIVSKAEYDKETAAIEAEAKKKEKELKR